MTSGEASLGSELKVLPVLDSLRALTYTLSMAAQPSEAGCVFMVPALGVPEPQPVKTDAQISAITDAVAIGLNILAIVLHELGKCREFGP